MILYDRSLKISLFDFGIQIPIFDTRATRTFQALRQNPVIGPQQDHWHLGAIGETLDRADLLRVHAKGYVDRLFGAELEAELIKTYELIDAAGRYYRYAPHTARLPLTQLFETTLSKAAGSTQCCRVALETGFCFFSGGAHHARFDTGSGFCVLNDIVIAARKLQSEGAVTRVWVIDVNAHKGDGTAALTESDATIRTLSIHMAKGWPLDGEAVDAQGRPNPAFIASDIDIPIAAGEEDHYLSRLERGLQKLADFKPADLAIVVGGADPYEHDELPSTADLRLSLEQLLARDQMIIRFLQKRGIATAWLMAGGYGQNSWKVYYQFLQWALLRE